MSSSPFIPIDANWDSSCLDTSQQAEVSLDQPKEEQAINLKACTDVLYEKEDDIHGVCGESDGWIPVVSKQ